MNCQHNCNHTFSCIKHVPIFANLNQKEMEEVSEISLSRAIKKGQMIYNAGDDGGKLFVVYKGNVKLFRLNPSGKEQVLRIIHPGEFFGELALFSSLPLTDYAQALSDSEMCILDGERLKEVMAKYPTIAFKVMDVLSRRLESAENQVESISLDPVEVRIARALLDMEDEHGEILLSMTKGDLASQLGMSQESLSRNLNSMQEEGLILLKGHKRIIIKDRQKLMEK